MFLCNKYKKWYFNIIKNSILRVYEKGKYEKHHIIPKSLGGTNDPENISLLTFREHLICHILLTKFTENQNKSKMIYALWSMQRYNKHYTRKLTSKQYEQIRKMFVNKMRNFKHSQSSKEKMSRIQKGIKKRNMFENFKRHEGIPKGIFEITTPDNIKKIVIGLKDFCKTENLSYTSMSSLANLNYKNHNGKPYESYKGYKIKKLGFKSA